MVRKLLAVIIFLPLLIIGGLTGYLWYSTKERVDRVIGQLALFVDVKYKSVFASPLGEVSVNDILITPRGTSDQFTLESIRVKAPHVLALLELDDNKLPDALAFSIEKLRIPFYSSFLENVSSINQATSGQGWDALGCGDIKAFGPDEYLAMGYQAPANDFSLSYTLDRASGVLRLTMASMTEGMVSSTLGLDFSSAFITSLADIPKTHLQFAGGQFTLTDRSYNERRNAFCVDQLQTDVAAYLDNHVRLLREQLAAEGISPSVGLVDAYRRYLAGPSRLTIELAPAQPIGVSDLSSIQPQQFIDQLGLRVAVNNVRVDDISLAFTAPMPADNTDGVAENIAEPPAPVIQTVAAPGRNNAGGYQIVSPNDAPRHVGKPSVVTTTGGSRYEGQLVATRDDALELRLRFSGGSVSYWFKFIDIDALHVKK